MKKHDLRDDKQVITLMAYAVQILHEPRTCDETFDSIDTLKEAAMYNFLRLYGRVGRVDGGRNVKRKTTIPLASTISLNAFRSLMASRSVLGIDIDFETLLRVCASPDECVAVARNAWQRMFTFPTSFATRTRFEFDLRRSRVLISEGGKLLLFDASRFPVEVIDRQEAVGRLYGSDVTDFYKKYADAQWLYASELTATREINGTALTVPVAEVRPVRSPRRIFIYTVGSADVFIVTDPIADKYEVCDFKRILEFRAEKRLNNAECFYPIIEALVDAYPLITYTQEAI